MALLILKSNASGVLFIPIKLLAALKSLNRWGEKLETLAALYS